MKIVWVIGVVMGLLSPAVLAEHAATEARQALFESIEQKTDELETLAAQSQWDQVVLLALGLEQSVAQLRDLFPDASRDEGRSKAKVWRNWSDFEARLTDWQGNYRQAATAAQNQAPQALERALEMATSQCRSCHRAYRSIW